MMNSSSPRPLLSLLLAAPAAAQDVQTLHYEFGPVKIKPGQNTIELEDNALKPPVNGWITRFTPEPRAARTAASRAWTSSTCTTASGSRTCSRCSRPARRRPRSARRPGYGWRYLTTDTWHMNHMIHNLTPTPEEVYITYDLDFVPDGTPPRRR